MCVFTLVLVQGKESEFVSLLQSLLFVYACQLSRVWLQIIEDQLSSWEICHLLVCIVIINHVSLFHSFIIFLFSLCKINGGRYSNISRLVRNI